MSNVVFLFVGLGKATRIERLSVVSNKSHLILELARHVMPIHLAFSLPISHKLMD